MDRGGFQGYRNTNSNSNATAAGLKLTDMKMNSNNGGSSSSNNSTPPLADDGECMVREQDRFMPIANVIRIMRKILPPHAKISDDAKETIQECVSEYISFITGEANERCQREQRKTITAEDVLWAMSKLGFDDYIEPLTIYLHRYREMEGDRGAIRGDPLVKRPSSAMDFGTQLGFAFGPAAAFRMGHPSGFLGAAAMGGYIKDASAGAAGSSQAAALANGQANGQCK